MDVGRVKLLGAGLATVGVEAVAVSQEHLSLVFTVAVVIGGVVGGITWLDKRNESRLKSHEKVEEDLNKERHERILSEIAHLHELINIRAEIRALRERTD